MCFLVFRGSQFLNSKPTTRNSKLDQLVAALLDWFSRHARDLPWRRTRDPYAIWVSEIMLQQTQVKTVIPYWERWMRELPTLAAAAQASPAKLHKLWEGLGYYTRVRNLQRAAQQIVANHRRDKLHESQTRRTIRDSRSSSLRFPEDYDAILALPGIGRYTAGAICSIAFNQPKPILDGNVMRVLTRVFGITTDPREKKTNAKLWQLAGELATLAHGEWGERPREPDSPKTDAARRESRPTNACSHLNQSLMELGALICTPRSPDCAACPVNRLCLAREKNLQEQLPNLGKRETATARRFIAFVVERNGKFLVRQRPERVVNARLWEFPNVEVGTRVCDPQHAAARKLGLKAIANHSPRTIKHSITRYRVTLEAWQADLATSARKIPGCWLKPKQLHELAFTSAHKKILIQLGVLR